MQRPGIGGSMGKLLVVDDDEMVRVFVTAILATLGYDIVEAKDGLEALLVYQAMRSEISLIIMDIMMPRMDGIAATKVIKATDPSTKVILMSGHSEHDPAEAKADGLVAVGIPVTRDPPHRSVRALLAHTAPVSDDGGEAFLRPRVKNAGLG